MASVWAELKRRNVVKVAVAYAIVGWLLVQIADVFFPALQLPEWTVTFVAALLLLGFPVALLLSWAYELTPDGIERTKSVPLSESIARVTGRKLDFVIIGLLALAVVFMFVDNYLPESGPFAGAEIDPASLDPAVDEARNTAPGADAETRGTSEILPNSVAVLPFENLSPDPDNGWFAAGIHGAILNELAKISSMNVISRTSMLAYADRATPIAEIARALNVETVMEGSVQYAEDRVRITAQLIDPETNAHLWSEDYDRDFVDLFAIQSDIAMNIANALEAEFSPAERESIDKRPTDSAAAYALYLEALSELTVSGSLSLLDRAIAVDPDFARALAQRTIPKAFTLSGVGAGLDPDQALELERSIQADAERALSIDPTLGLARAALGVVHQANWRGAAAEEAFRHAVQLNPNDVGVLVLYGRFKRLRGERDEAIRLHRRAVELDPNNVTAISQLGFTYRYVGAWNDAADAFQAALNQQPASINWNTQLGYVEASRGNTAEAVELLQLAERLGESTVYRVVQIAHAYALAGLPEEAMGMFAEFEERATEEGIGHAWWANAYIAVENYDQALQRIESAVNDRLPVDQTALAILALNPWGDPELDRPEFRTFLDGLWTE